MTDVHNSYVIENVDALFPRINQTYKFDMSVGEKGRSVPCDPFDTNAVYEMKFKMSGPTAKALYKAMNDAFINFGKRDDSWPNELTIPFKQDEEEEDIFIHKALLKGQYKNKATKPPAQFDSKNTPLPEDFLLTTGSTVNIAIEFTPYKLEGRFGVSLRLRAVQVLKYIPYTPKSPFGEVENGFSGETNGALTGAELFPAEDNTPEAAPIVEVNLEVFDEPKVKKSTKKVTKPKPEIDLGALLDEFDD